jgi:TRAP-type mannitol/chloroaromatic compound transport system permease small subunit
LLLPFIALILIYSVPFVASSYALAEVSASPGGLPLRWLIKAALPLGFSLLLLTVLSRLLRVWSLLFVATHNAAQGDIHAGQ